MIQSLINWLEIRCHDTVSDQLVGDQISTGWRSGAMIQSLINWLEIRCHDTVSDQLVGDQVP